MRQALKDNMLRKSPKRDELAVKIVRALSSAQVNKTHNKHLPIDRLQALGIKVEALEDDQDFQEAVLTVHHCYIHTMTNTAALKIVENQNGRALVRNAQQTQQQLIRFGSPA